MSASTPENHDARQGETRSPGIAVFTSHWLAMLGLGLVLTSIALWACLLPAQLRHGQENPYAGVAMIVVTGVLVLGLVLTPLGVYLGRRRVKLRLANAATEGRVAWKRFFVFLAVVSIINVAIASQGTLRVVHEMETRQFCGSCHVMTPEARAFELGPHGGLQCVDCHVGNGALGFLKSKWQGSRQLWMVMTDKIPKPIQGAIETDRMVPSAETCEECHWKARPAGAKLKLIRRFGMDEANTPETTLLTMNVGGSRMGGIHGAHNIEGIEMRFVANDPKRQDIPLVEWHDLKTGKTKVYVKAGVDAASLNGRPRITMQCFDCHNRPAHVFQSPEAGVDRALTLGRMSASLPFLKKTSVEILKADYPTSDAAATAIPAALKAWYEKNQPEVARTRAADVQEAGNVLADVYAHNVFPELGVTWGLYPDNLGHEDYPGCFRCHDGNHVTAEGTKLTNNCFKCHYPAAVGETKAEVLELLGVDEMLKKLQKK